MSEKRCPMCQRNPHIEETGCSEEEYQDCVDRAKKQEALEAENKSLKEKYDRTYDKLVKVGIDKFHVEAQLTEAQGEIKKLRDVVMS